jgi:hypothetical protein
MRRGRAWSQTEVLDACADRGEVRRREAALEEGVPVYRRKLLDGVGDRPLHDVRLHQLTHFPPEMVAAGVDRTRRFTPRPSGRAAQAVRLADRACNGECGLPAAVP